MLDKFYLTFGGAFFMAKYSYEEKLEAVLRVIDEGMSQTQSAKILGTHDTCVHKWLQLYNELGPEGLNVKHGSYTGEFKQNVIEYMHKNHLSNRQTAAKFGIPAPSVVDKWERIYYEEGPQGLYMEKRGRKSNMSSDKPRKRKLSKQTEEDLIAEVQRLRMENEYLKKLNALVQERIARENGKEPPSSMN